MQWEFQEPRDVIPWMFLKLTPRDRGKAIVLIKGLCAPEIPSGAHQETWRITASEQIPDGEYAMEAFFVDNSKRLWAGKMGQRDAQQSLLVSPMSLGELKVLSGKGPAPK
jgi:hypothetical protein